MMTDFRLSVFILTLISLGCSGENGSSSSVDQNSTQTADVATTQSAESEQTQPMAVDPNHKETKWIGTIPYDVFFDDPLTVASDQTKVATTVDDSVAPSVDSESSAPAPTEVPTTNNAAQTPAVDWGQILPMEHLIDEIKAIRTRLGQNMQTVATYNKATEAIALDGATLTALGAIASEQQNDSTWQPRGKFVRDLGYEISMNASGTGRSAFSATEEPFLKLMTVLDGGTIDFEPQESVANPDVIFVADIMKLIDASLKAVKANVNTESRLKENPAGIEREMRVLAALMAIMRTDGYDNADADLYQKLTGNFFDGAMQSAEAAKSEDFESFKTGLSMMQNTCAECHQQYKSNSTGF